MSDPARDVADLVAALLRALPAADLAALTEGRARLAVVPLDAAPPADRTIPAGHPAAAPARPSTRRAASAPDPAAARAALETMSRRDDGTAYLSGWTARDLRVLAASLELRGVAGLRKADLVERIVDRTIGFRLASAAIRRL
ncbi:Rho termination factor N-terminal domain-containing protein [Micromonospora sp. NPDC049051]|uniref:Rho termination factor N-terminal domain-containing protein n=1 Tax=Micromonospora sp. NPDC049051 TaxID=3364264 RepID=UPI00371FAC7E